jgi:hypothetical protein
MEQVVSKRIDKSYNRKRIPRISKKLNMKVEAFGKVDTNKLLEEYLTIRDDKFENIWNRTDAVLVQRRFHLLFKNEKINKFETTMFPYTFEVATQIASLFNFNSITYRIVQPNTAYYWHKDSGKISYHIPLITNLGCYFIYDSESHHMPIDDCIYKADTEFFHTFVNAGDKPRVHLVFEKL